MMLDFLGNGDERYHAAHNGILAAIEQVIASGPKNPGHERQRLNAAGQRRYLQGHFWRNYSGRPRWRCAYRGYNGTLM